MSDIRYAILFENTILGHYFIGKKVFKTQEEAEEYGKAHSKDGMTACTINLIEIDSEVGPTFSESEKELIVKALKTGFYRIFGGDYDTMEVEIGKLNKDGTFWFTIWGYIFDDPNESSTIMGKSSLELCKKVDKGYSPWFTNKGELY